VGSGWDDLELVADAGTPGRFTTAISDPWMLRVVPQGGVVAAIAERAMRTTLDHPGQVLRTMTVAFVGQVAGGPVEVDVQLLRRGRSMSHLTATVHNPGASAGLTAIAVYGGVRRGFEFTEAAPPAVDGPDGLRSYRDPIPEGVDFEFDGDPMPFWDEVIECRPAMGRPPWEPQEPGPAEMAYWYRLDDPPVGADGLLDTAGLLVMCDTMPGAVSQRLDRDQAWFGPSVDLTFHQFRSVPPGWVLAHNRARHAGDGYASVDMTLWDPTTHQLLAYATQLMFFAFL
jgi:acyl-CoA thioesterase